MCVCVCLLHEQSAHGRQSSVINTRSGQPAVLSVTPTTTTEYVVTTWDDMSTV